MRITFWVAAAVIVYTYIGYPMWLCVRSRAARMSWKQSEITPTVSIILCVHNGGSFIQEQVRHLLATDYPNVVELIVVSDGSTDGTVEALSDMSDPLLRIFICDEHRGKAAALNVGIRNAVGEILVFVDIRPRLENRALRQLVGNFADPMVGCAAGELILRHVNHDPTAAAVTCFYWRYEQWLRTCESAIDSPCGVYGGFYAVRRSLATEFPGGLILDDMYQPLQIVRQGYRCVLDSGARVSDLWPTEVKREFQRKVRTLAGNFQLLRLAPWLLWRENRLRFQFVSHKVLRLVVPYFLLVCLGACISLRNSSFYFALLLVQAAVYMAALLGFVADLPALRVVTGSASAFCLLNAAAVVGFWKFVSVRGPLWRIWVPTGLGDLDRG